jgi:indole-3-glycerol phosphate synthase
VAHFAQAISEGDGISLVPLLTSDVETLARAAEEAGAEALAVDSAADVERVRAAVSLPVMLRRRIRSADELRAAETAGADGIVLAVTDLDDDEALEELHGEAAERGFDVALDVAEEEDLERALELVDPDIFWICDRSGDHEEAFERTLDLLPDVPAGKLVVAESRAVAREQVVALERAGVDALVVTDVGTGGDFARSLAELVGRA